MTDKDSVFDFDAVANECVARDLTISANRRTALDLDKSTDPGSGPNSASVQIDEARVEYFHTRTKHYIIGDHWGGLYRKRKQL